MFSVTEAQLLAWLNPLLWPFIRTLALFAGMPTFSQRNVPLRLRVGLALFIAVAAQASLPETSAARRAPTAAPALTPTPPMICEPARVAMVRRCSAWVITEGSMTRTLSLGVVPHPAGPP